MLTVRTLAAGSTPHYPWSAMSTVVTPPSAAPRTYEIRTHGCQMNVHDSERLAGLLETAGYRRAADGGTPDVVVFNTCAVRENADNRLYGSLGHLRPTKRARPGMQIAVGGCLAQKDQHEIVRRAPWVDVVFGTHNLGALPVLLERARIREEAQVEIADAAADVPLPPAHRAGLGVRGLGLDQRRLQQHLHLLHRAGAARQGGGPATGGDPGRDRDAGRRRGAGDHPAGSERERVRGRLRRPQRVREAAPPLRRGARAWSGCGSPRRIRRTSPTR